MSKSMVATLVALLALIIVFAIAIPIGGYSPAWIYVPVVPFGLLVYWLYIKSKWGPRPPPK